MGCFMGRKHPGVGLGGMVGIWVSVSGVVGCLVVHAAVWRVVAPVGVLAFELKLHPIVLVDREFVLHRCTRYHVNANMRMPILQVMWRGRWWRPCINVVWCL
jgi:hypothetical protein